MTSLLMICVLDTLVVVIGSYDVLCSLTGQFDITGMG